ncbi:phage tail protein [Paracoccus sp. 22332]|uniref:phage tail protein n=1 Tax=Paracoccus sp. 22332 TaxID=3453913 RepID=UPI003F87BF69
MATLPETDEYPLGIYQLETADPVLGGPPNEATKAGVDNIPHQQLAKRTRWLKVRVDNLLNKVIAATTAVAGIVRLSSATNSISETEAATPKAVKSAWDNAESRALKSTEIKSSGLLSGGGPLSSSLDLEVRIATQAEAETGVLDNRAMTPLKTLQAITARLGGRSVTTAGLAIGGGALSADRQITVPDATQAEAEAGSATNKAMSPLRVAQAIAARLAARSVETAGLATGGGALSANRTITVPVATLADAQNGESHDVAMTPLRTAQYVSRLFLRSIAGNGYITLPGGLILQWLSVSIIGSNLSASASLPTAFPNAPFGALATRRSATPIEANDASATDLGSGHVTVRRAASPGNTATYLVVALGW